MATGKVHSHASIGAGLALFGTGALSYVLQPDQIMLAGVSAGTLGLVFGNDLDVDNGYIGDYYIRKFFLTDFFYDIVFEAYRQGIKHRSKLSHWPLLGTAVRLLYLIFPPIIVLVHDQPTPATKLLLLSLPALLFSALLWVSTLILLQYFYWGDILYYAVGVVYGLIVSDTIHYIFDKG